MERIAACFYPLESLEVTMSDTEEFTVNGHDEVAIENFADADVGALIYTLEIEVCSNVFLRFSLFYSDRKSTTWRRYRFLN